MTENTLSPLGKVISIDDERIKNHLDRVVRGTVDHLRLAALATVRSDVTANGMQLKGNHKRDPKFSAFARIE